MTGGSERVRRRDTVNRVPILGTSFGAVNWTHFPENDESHGPTYISSFYPPIMDLDQGSFSRLATGDQGL